MRPIIDRIAPTLPAADQALLAEARTAEKIPAEHARLLPKIEALHLLEVCPPAEPQPVPPRITVASFNAERLKFPAAARWLLDDADVQVALLTEVDIGMARSGNRHTIEALTAESGEGHVYGVEFLELDLGDPIEMREHAGQSNSLGFHGNAIVSDFVLSAPHLIPLEKTGRWFGGKDGAQHRIGGRMALAARLEGTRQPVWLVTVHLESQSDPDDRALQMRRLIEALDRIAPNAAMVVGGDLNTKDLPRDEAGLAEILDAPQRFEPLFDVMRDAGFDWRSANLPVVTQRTGPSGEPEPPFGKLDWLFVRGLLAHDPRVIPALDEMGRPISDHEMLCVEIALPG